MKSKNIQKKLEKLEQILKQKKNTFYNKKKSMKFMCNLHKKKLQNFSY